MIQIEIKILKKKERKELKNTLNTFYSNCISKIFVPHVRTASLAFCKSVAALLLYLFIYLLQLFFTRSCRHFASHPRLRMDGHIRSSLYGLHPREG